MGRLGDSFSQLVSNPENIKEVFSFFLELHVPTDELHFY
jgi:hypothetical protein